MVCRALLPTVVRTVEAWGRVHPCVCTPSRNAIVCASSPSRAHTYTHTYTHARTHQAIEGEGLDGVAVLVTRYYGGTALGVGGLVRAYGGCVRDTLRAAPKEVVRARTQLRFSLEFKVHGPVGVDVCCCCCCTCIRAWKCMHTCSLHSFTNPPPPLPPGQDMGPVFGLLAKHGAERLGEEYEGGGARVCLTVGVDVAAADALAAAVSDATSGKVVASKASEPLGPQ